MTIIDFIERFFSLSFFIVGVSHAVQPKLWRDFFILIKSTGVAGIIIAMYTFPLGLLIVVGHNVWVWDVPVITTICGWGMTIKSLTYVLISGRAERMIPDDVNAHRKYALGGMVIIPITALMIWDAFFRA